MAIHDKGIQQTKDRIKMYYQTKRSIIWQQQRLDKLSVRLQDIERDMNNPKRDFSLRTDLRAVNYDRARVTGGQLAASSMEREIEEIYRRLEQEYLKTKTEMIQTKMLIRKLEKENEAIEYCIGLLETEDQEILSMKFAERKSLLSISFEKNMSKSNVDRVLCEIYVEISKTLDHLKNVGQNVDESETGDGQIVDGSEAGDGKSVDENGNFSAKNLI